MILLLILTYGLQELVDNCLRSVEVSLDKKNIKRFLRSPVSVLVLNYDTHLYLLSGIDSSGVSCALAL